MPAVADPEVSTDQSTGDDDPVHVLCESCGDQGEFFVSLCGLAFALDEVGPERPVGPLCRECKPKASDHWRCIYGTC